MSEPSSPRRKVPQPWVLPVVDDADIFAVKAVFEARADEHAQRRFVDYLRRLSGFERMSFWPGGEDGRRATDFAEGKRWMFGQLRRLANLQPTGIDARDEPPAMPAHKSEVNDVA